MGCCHAKDDDEVDREEKEGLAGPKLERSCTDLPCLLIFMAYLAAFWALSAVIVHNGDIELVLYGQDYTGKVCRGVTFYPDLATDFRESPTLFKKYGICLDRCPSQGQLVEDPKAPGTRRKDGPAWYVTLPTAPVANRCVPFQQNQKNNSGLLCAYPRCEPVAEPPAAMRNVCGPKRDVSTGMDMSSYWVLGGQLSDAEKKTEAQAEHLDGYLVDGWEADGADASLIEKREALWRSTPRKTTFDQCDVLVERSVQVKVYNSQESITANLLTYYTGMLFSQASFLYENKEAVFLLGFVGAIVLSMLIIATFSCCVRYVILMLILWLFVVLIVVNYILYRKGDLNSGRTGAKVSHWLLGDSGSSVRENGYVDVDRISDALLQEVEDPRLQMAYRVCAFLLSFAIVVLVFIVASMKKNLDLLVALCSEAAETLREMPSLLLFPFLGVGSMVGFTFMLVYVLLSVMTLDPETALKWAARLPIKNVDDPSEQAFYVEQAQNMMMLTVLFVFLWIYFFHMAVFISTVAHAVSHWYFYRNDPDPDRNDGVGANDNDGYFGKPVIIALGRVFRYHLGTLAFGSWLIAICTMPRIILEYIDQETKRAQELNPMLKAAICACRCCLWCFNNCIKFLTNYAYINTAVSGRAFCPAAHASFVLMAKYPVQVMLDQIASMSLQVISCLIVPATLISVAYFVIPTGWGISALFIGGLSFTVTRIAVGVYDVCITTLFVCVTKDLEHFNGKYAPDGLREAMRLPKRRSVMEGVELS